MAEKKRTVTKKKTGKKALSKGDKSGKGKGRPKGQPRTGGRIKGTANKKTIEVIETLAKLKCDPIAGMAKIAMDARSPLDLESLEMVRRIKNALQGKKDLLEFFEMLLSSWRNYPPELRAKMFSELAQYVFPKRKAIEHTGQNGEPLQISIVKFGSKNANSSPTK